ncbi:carboxylesterase, partial [Planoprotostelium fungivorum]
MLTSIITLLIVTLAAVLAQEPTVTYPGNNTVVGVAVSGGVNVYRKIPFARPPAPIYLNDTNQFYNGTQYAPECIQSVNAGSEDCLYLAVYVPPGATNTSKLPVRHWIYGGSYTSGDYYSDGYYDGTALAAQTNTIVVASNYRVGILGFFVSTTTINSSSTGNYGLLDQQTALRWTHENIAAFGGDPNNVTIFGESAGGSSVNFQLLMNGSWPYFRRAIIESGGPWNFRTIKQLTALNDYLLNSLGLSNCDLACLQGLSVDLLANIPAVPFGQPVIDGTLITDQPLN